MNYNAWTVGIMAFYIEKAKSGRVCEVQLYLMVRGTKNRIPHTCTRTSSYALVLMGCFILRFWAFCPVCCVHNMIKTISFTRSISERVHDVMHGGRLKWLL